METKKNSKAKEIAKTVILLAVILCVIVFLFLRFSAVWEFLKKLFSILTPFFIGIILCYLANPLFERIRKALYLKKTKKRLADGISSAVCIMIVIIAVVGVFALVIPKVYESLGELSGNIPVLVSKLTAWYYDLADSDFVLKEFVIRLYEYVSSNMEGMVSDNIKPNIGQIASGVFSSVVNVIKAFYNFIIGLIAMVYLLNNKDNLLSSAKRLTYSLMPKKANPFCARIRQFNRIFGGFILGKLVDSLIIGILCFIITSIFRIPYALLISVIVGVTNIIPFFGPIIGAVPSALIVTIDDPKKGLIFIIIVIVLQQIDGNLIGPKILGNSTGISGLSVLFSIIVGGGLFGFAGMLLAVPAWAFITAIIDEHAAVRLEKAGLPTDVRDYGKGLHPKPATKEPEREQKESKMEQSIEKAAEEVKEAAEEVKKAVEEMKS